MYEAWGEGSFILWPVWFSDSVRVGVCLQIYPGDRKRLTPHAPPSGGLPGRWLLGPCLLFGYLRPLRTAYSSLGIVGVRGVQPPLAERWQPLGLFFGFGLQLLILYVLIGAVRIRLLWIFVFTRRQSAEM